MGMVDQTELDRHDGAEPADVVDRLLWRDAQEMLRLHTEADADGSCVGCGRRWPCAPRRIGERAATAARRPWRVAWTLRHDLNSIRAMPGTRTASARRTNERSMIGTGTNRGFFD
jgi:hypothetical protein